MDDDDDVGDYHETILLVGVVKPKNFTYSKQHQRLQ